MGENLQEDFGLLVDPLDGGDHRAEPTLVAAEGALGLCPLTVDTFGIGSRGASCGTGGPSAAGTS